MRITFLIIISILFTFITSAQEVDFEGYGATGFKFYNRETVIEYNQETYYEGKLQAEIKYNKKIKAQLDFRGNSTDNAVSLREFSLKLEFFKKLYFKIGNLKMPFGYEQLVNREELYTVDRSFVNNKISEVGYGERKISIMAYHEFDKDEKDFPYSYYFYVFKDNSLYHGAMTRLSYHNNDFIYSINYLFQQKGGNNPISANGFGADVAIEKKDFHSSLQLFYVQDPEEGIRRELQNLNNKIFSTGATYTAAYNFEFNEEFLKGIEPLILVGIFVPDSDLSEYHTIQSILGINFYIDKDVRFRINGDLRFIKSKFNSAYSTQSSRGIFEIQVSF